MVNHGEISKNIWKYINASLLSLLAVLFISVAFGDVDGIGISIYKKKIMKILLVL